MKEYRKRLEELFKREISREFIENLEELMDDEPKVEESDTKLLRELLGEDENPTSEGNLDDIYDTFEIDEDWIFENLIQKVEVDGKVYTAFVEPLFSLYERKPVVILLYSLEEEEEKFYAKMYYSLFEKLQNKFFRDVLLSRALEFKRFLEEKPDEFTILAREAIEEKSAFSTDEGEIIVAFDPKTLKDVDKLLR